MESKDPFILGRNFSSLRNISRNQLEPFPYRVSLYYNNSTIPGAVTRASLISSEIQSTVVDTHGVCLQFAFRVRGQQTELSMVLDREGANEEYLWKSATLNQTYRWEEGRVWLGIVSRFRVSS